MYKVSQKIVIGTKYCISVEGDVTLLKTGLKLKNENGNIEVDESKSGRLKNLLFDILHS